MIGFSIFIGVILLSIGILMRFGKKNLSRKDVKRRYISDVKTGEDIRIEWDRFANSGIGWVRCLNNDPKTKTIFLEVKWSNWKTAGCPEREQLILGYDNFQLKNFHLLNSGIEEKQKEQDDDDVDIATLQKKMNEAMEREEYEKAGELQKKIDKLTKKK